MHCSCQALLHHVSNAWTYIPVIYILRHAVLLRINSCSMCSCNTRPFHTMQLTAYVLAQLHSFPSSLCKACTATGESMSAQHLWCICLAVPANADITVPLLMMYRLRSTFKQLAQSCQPTNMTSTMLKLPAHMAHADGDSPRSCCMSAQLRSPSCKLRA